MRKSEATRRRVLSAALKRFRRQGFERTTMREIAEDAGIAVGGAYYYFPSKEAIVVAYYESTQRVVRERCEAAFLETPDDVRARLGVALHARLDVLGRDRKLLAALFHTIADPSTDASIFGERTRAVREDSIRLLAEAVAPAPEIAQLDEASRRVLALSLWSLHMGVLLYFVHDRSAKQRRTHLLVDQSLDFVCALLPAAPQLAPMLGTTVFGILRDAELL